VTLSKNIIIETFVQPNHAGVAGDASICRGFVFYPRIYKAAIQSCSSII